MGASWTVPAWAAKGAAPGTPGTPPAANQRSGGKSALRAADGEDVDELAAEDAGAAAAARNAEKEELPTMEEITQLVPVQSGKVLFLVPLRSNEATTKIYFDETARLDEVLSKTAGLVNMLDAHFRGQAEKLSLVDLSVGGVVDVTAARSTNTKNKRTGMFKWRVKEEYAEYCVAQTKAAFVCVPVFEESAPEGPTYEIILPTRFYPTDAVERTRVFYTGTRRFG
jgi:hypothetical protein